MIRAWRTASGPERLRIVGRILLRLVALGVAGVVVGIIAFAGLIAYYGRDLPDVTRLRDYHANQTTRVVDRHGELVGEIFTERRTMIPATEIPNVMVVSVLAAEDANFYAHRGLDYRGIARAILRDIISGRAAQGASTITQQVVKVLLLTPERSLSRKIRELVLARRIEQTLSKEEILALYLNVINFGDGRYGVEEASQYYFGKHARDLSLAEASMLAGLPQSPTRLNPFHDLEAAERRQRYVLGQLEAKLDSHFRNHLTLEDIQRARDTPIVLADPHRTRSNAPEIMELVRRDLRRIVGEDAFRRGGYRVETTIDLDVTEETREALRAHLERIDQRQGFRGPLPLPRPGRRTGTVTPLPAIPSLRIGRSYLAEVTGTDDTEGRIDLDVGGHRAYARMRDSVRYNPGDMAASAFAPRGARVHVSIDVLGEGDNPSRARLELGPEGAVVVIDPRTHGILAMIGGSAASAGLNRATQAHRQPGSTFKPFVYAAALRSRRFTPASLVTPEDIAADSLTVRVPDADELTAPVALRSALARSLNPVSMHLFLALGPQPVIELAHAAGIQSELDPNPSLSLGTSEVYPLELVNSYATLAAGGRYEEPFYIAKIVGPDGREVRLPARAAGRQALEPAEAYLITSLMRSVVEQGTAVSARTLRRPVAGKTGTSNEARDTWFVGFTPTTVAGVWVGFDDRRPLGRGEEGARSALPVFIETIRLVEGDSRPAAFALPPGIDIARIDPRTGLLAPPSMPDGLEEQFLSGTAPTEMTAVAPPDAGVPVAPEPTSPPSELPQQPATPPDPDDDPALAP